MATPQSFNVDRTTALYERVPMSIGDQPTYAEVKQAVESHFASGNIVKFLKSLQSSALRIRDFEAVLRAGKLGSQTAGLYAKLNGGDQGLIREQYLNLLERIDTGLRDKFFKLYAYY